MASVADSPHRVPVAQSTVNDLHEGSVEAHHTWITCVENSNRSVHVKKLDTGSEASFLSLVFGYLG